MTRKESALKTIQQVASKTEDVIVFCSLGKDSLVVLDLAYPYFKRIVCVFMYFVKGLEHIERWINWVKTQYPKVEFVQVPHWNLTYILRGGAYCIPNPNVKLMRLRDVVNNTMLKYNINYCFLGMKKADGMNRRMMLNTYTENNYENKGLVYPLAEWTQKDVLAYMKHRRLPQPVRYGKNASNGVGFNVDCFLWMRENFPQDLQKIYKVFPLSERILLEYDYKNKGE